MLSSSMSSTPIEEPNRVVERHERDLSDEIMCTNKLIDTVGLK